ncbi:MAG: hypothetical protein AABX07_00770 [Nanoarchaeota archaeon]
MKIKHLTSTLALAGIVGSIPLGSYVAAKKTDLLDARPIPIFLEVNGEKKTMKIPRYNLFKIPPGNCARYAKNVARDVFGLRYDSANAWDLRYKNKIVTSANNEQLDDLVKRGDLKPGMLVGVYNPKSAHINDLDATGNKVAYTHMIVYLGKSDGKLRFAHQFKTKFEIFGQDDLSKRGLEAREVIAPKDYLSKGQVGMRRD